MFKNHAIQLNLVKKPSNASPDSPELPIVNPDEIAQIIMYHAGHATKLVIGTIAAYKLLDTVSSVITIAACAHFNK